MSTDFIEPLEERRMLAAVRLAVVGDFSVDTQTAPTRDVANLVSSWNPSNVVTVGDNNYPNGAASTIDANIGQWYHSFMSPYTGAYGAGSADGVNHFFPALGNHDWNSSAGATPFTNYFNLPNNERYYSTQVGNVGIFVVDSEPQEPDGTSSTSTQANWIRNAMLNSTAQWKLVFFHHPAYSSGGLGSNAYMQWPFASWGATAVFAGHDHDYERLSENGIPYFIDGLGGESIVGFGSTVSGSQVRYAGDYGAMRIDADSASITFQFITRTGSLIDSYTVGTVAAPAPPTNLVATAAAASIGLNWQDNSTNETGFIIDRSPDGVTFSPLVTVPSGSTSYTDASVVQGNSYTYRVRATNSGGDSTNSNTASATVPVSSTVNVIPPGAVWKYLDNGTNQGTAWRATTFDDGTWKSGKAELGYGDGDEATVVGYGSNANNKYVTTYFRDSFNIIDPTSVTALNMQLVVDDGAAVYLNGTEVYRFNLPTGTISSTTLATTALGGADESMWRPATINPALLVAGSNTIAVEIHQADVTSSDISFNYQLAATTSQTSNAPAAPTNLAASPLSATQIMLTWQDNSTTETGFKIERSTDGLNFAQIDTVAPNITTYTDSSLTSGATYSYRVRASGSATDSTYSNIASAAPYSIPAAPSNLLATAGVSQINLTWKSNSTNQTGFKIERSIDGVNFSLIYGAEDTDTSYVDSSVSVGTTFYYRIYASNPAGNSGYSEIASAAIAPDPGTIWLSDLAPASSTNGFGPVEKDMSNGAGNAGDGTTITLNGVPYAKGLGVNAISQIVYNLNGAYSTFLSDVGVDDEEVDTATIDFQVLADGVKVFDSGVMRATSVTQSINLNLTGVQQLTLILTDAGDGTTNDHGDWAGARLVAGPVVTPPAAPSGLGASASGTNINLNWQDNSTNETGFKIERSTDGVTFSPLFTTGAGVTTYSDTSAVANTPYTYQVRSTNTAGDSAPSNTATAVVSLPTGTVYLSDLSWVSATSGWGPVEKDMSNGSNGAGDGHTITLNGATYAKGLGAHANSQIVYNLGGQYTTFISDVGVDDEEVDTATIDFQVMADGVKVFDSGVMLASSPTQTVNVSVASVQQLTLVITDTGDGNTCDHGDWAGARLITNANAVAAPSNLTALAASSTSINLSWQDNSSNETGFKIERSTDGVTFSLLTTTLADVTSFSDAALVSGATYTYRVRATNDSGDSGNTTPASATTPLPSPWTQGDIGTVGKAGSATNNNGVWTVTGAGSNIAATTDSFHFVYQALTGDGTIIARVASVQNTNSTAKAGVMIRETLAAGSKHALIDVKPGGGIEFIRRTSTNGSTTTTSATGSALPEWIKLVRAANTFTAYKSTTGTTWTKVASASITMASQVYIGLVVCSRSTSTLNTSTFDNIQLSGGVAVQAAQSVSLFSATKVTATKSSVLS